MAEKIKIIKNKNKNNNKFMVKSFMCRVKSRLPLNYFLHGKVFMCRVMPKGVASCKN